MLYIKIAYEKNNSLNYKSINELKYTLTGISGGYNKMYSTN